MKMSWKANSLKVLFYDTDTLTAHIFNPFVRQFNRAEQTGTIESIAFFRFKDYFAGIQKINC